MGLAPPPRPGADQEFNDRYEAVRQWAVARPRPSSCPAGATVLIRQGLPAWLRAWRGPADARAPALPAVPNTPRRGTAREQALASVLATMVEYSQEEDTR